MNKLLWISIGLFAICLALFGLSAAIWSDINWTDVNATAFQFVLIGGTASLCLAAVALFAARSPVPSRPFRIALTALLLALAGWVAIPVGAVLPMLLGPGLTDVQSAQFIVIGIGIMAAAGILAIIGLFRRWPRALVVATLIVSIGLPAIAFGLILLSSQLHFGGSY